MKCPDCGGFLVEVTFSGIDKSWRCFTCGGVFLRGKTATGLPDEALKNWNEVQVDPEILKNGDNACPRDGNKLKIFTGENIPEDVIVRQCEQCNWWWFPTDSLFRFKPPKTARTKPATNWGPAGTIAAIALPLMVMTVIIGRVTMRQQITTSAGAGVSHYAATYLGEGKELVTFSSNDTIARIVIRRGDGKWTELPVNKQGNVYEVRIEGLSDGENYELTIGGKTFKFETKL